MKHILNVLSEISVNIFNLCMVFVLENGIFTNLNYIPLYAHMDIPG